MCIRSCPPCQNQFFFCKHVLVRGCLIIVCVSQQDGGGGQVIMSRISHDFKEVFNVTLTYGQSPMHVNLQTVLVYS